MFVGLLVFKIQKHEKGGIDPKFVVVGQCTKLNVHKVVGLSFLPDVVVVWFELSQETSRETHMFTHTNPCKIGNLLRPVMFLAL